MLGMQVVAEPTPWQGGTVAISNFGFGGSNVHCLVRGSARAPAAPSPVPVAEGADSAPSARLDPEVRSRCCESTSVHRASTVP